MMAGGETGALERGGRVVAPLQPVPGCLDAPTELILAATAVTLSADGASVTRAMRERLMSAAEQLQTEGLPAAWYHLADIAKRYVRDWQGADRAPRYRFTPLIGAATHAGVPTAFAWQGWAQ